MSGAFIGCARQYNPARRLFTAGGSHDALERDDAMIREVPGRRPRLDPAIGPARTLEGIEAEVGQVGHVGLGLVAEPARGLVDETILVVADAHGTKLAFTEVPDLVAIRGALAGDQVHLVVAVEMHFVGAITQLLALLQLFGDV